jgi:hypothetical protein
MVQHNLPEFRSICAGVPLLGLGYALDVHQNFDDHTLVEDFHVGHFGVVEGGDFVDKMGGLEAALDELNDGVLEEA